MDFNTLLQNYTVVGNSNFTTLMGGFTDGLSQAKFYYLEILSRVDDLVIWLFGSYPSALHIVIIAALLWAVVYIPLRVVSKW